MHCPNFITLQTFFLGVGIFFSISVSFQEFRLTVCKIRKSLLFDFIHKILMPSSIRNLLLPTRKTNFYFIICLMQYLTMFLTKHSSYKSNISELFCMPLHIYSLPYAHYFVGYIIF